MHTEKHRRSEPFSHLPPPHGLEDMDEPTGMLIEKRRIEARNQTRFPKIRRRFDTDKVIELDPRLIGAHRVRQLPSSPENRVCPTTGEDRTEVVDAVEAATSSENRYPSGDFPQFRRTESRHHFPRKIDYLVRRKPDDIVTKPQRLRRDGRITLIGLSLGHDRDRLRPCAERNSHGRNIYRINATTQQNCRYAAEPFQNRRDP